MKSGLFCRLRSLVASENFDIRENPCQSPAWHPSHGGAALPRGGGRLRGLTGGRRYLSCRAPSLSLCINPTCASPRTSSSGSRRLVPLQQTHVTRPMKPHTAAFAVELVALGWKSFSSSKVCLVRVTSWKCASNHFRPCREMVSMGAINTASVQVSGCWAVSPPQSNS